MLRPAGRTSSDRAGSRSRCRPMSFPRSWRRSDAGLHRSIRRGRSSASHRVDGCAGRRCARHSRASLHPPRMPRELPSSRQNHAAGVERADSAVREEPARLGELVDAWRLGRWPALALRIGPSLLGRPAPALCDSPCSHDPRSDIGRAGVGALKFTTSDKRVKTAWSETMRRVGRLLGAHGDEAGIRVVYASRAAAGSSARLFDTRSRSSQLTRR